MAKPELRDHRKFLKLKRLLPEPVPHLMGYLECLWLRGYQTGSAFVGDSLDVEAAAEYPGDPGRFTAAALAAGFIDQGDDGSYSIHDLFDHAPRYAKLRMGRKGNAPKKCDTDSAQIDEEVPESRTDGAHSRTRMRANDENAHECAPETITQTENLEPKSKEEDKTGVPAKPAKRFVPPTVDEVAVYCREIASKIDPSNFVDYYTSNGWRVGQNAMKDWKATVRTWSRKERGNGRGPPGRSAPQSRELDLLAEIENAQRQDYP